MATLVRQKKFKKKKRNKLTKKIQRTKLIYPKLNFSIKWFWIFILIVIFSYGLFFIINNTIFKPENYIEQITYSKASVDNYDDPYLYKKISDLIKYENYFVVSKFRKSDIINQIKSEFPLVKDLEIIQPAKFTASVRVDFYEPDIVVRLGDRKFGVFGRYNFEIFSGNKIGNGIFSVEIPQYTTGIDNLHGMFFEIPQDKFIFDMETIAQGFPGYKRLVYLPGSSMTVVFVSNNKRVYLNNKNSLTGQITNYNLLQKYYDEANKLRIIDLGSLEGNKIIVRQ
ncbi:MAG TPA: hypothetical protein VJ892_00135 [Candidatus Absconditabacterales bacterium]|nr:hypothetical protein [Candidatus Absconditabacterales bacterium]